MDNAIHGNSNPARKTNSVTRRKALTATGLGMAALAATSSRAQAAEWTDQEKANVQVVNDFCAAWSTHDLAKVTSFFADNGAYRMTEAQDPIKGLPAVTERIKSFLDRVSSFEVMDTFAKGPMVFNERMDHFTGGNLRTWHGVGVFFLKDGKIVEWYDYTIAIDRG
jgi:limonene-1,2-epoxide hydrolase